MEFDHALQLTKITIWPFFIFWLRITQDVLAFQPPEVYKAVHGP